MSYDLAPRNREADYFHFGAFSWPVLLEACGYLFPVIHHGGRYYMAYGIDPREDGTYPGILANDGFRVTAEEARIMARMARNFVAIQRTLPEENQEQSVVNRPEGVNREQLMALLTRTVSGTDAQPWPRKIRTDFVDRFEQFAAWAEKSGGFSVG